eukprot:4751816-Alexandrium_andersonii.AAC.1
MEKYPQKFDTHDEFEACKIFKKKAETHGTWGSYCEFVSSRVVFTNPNLKNAQVFHINHQMMKQFEAFPAHLPLLPLVGAGMSAPR